MARTGARKLRIAVAVEGNVPHEGTLGVVFERADEELVHVPLFLCY